MSSYGMRLLYSSEEQGGSEPHVDVVAVHGIGADPDKTWVSEHVNWLKDEQMLPRAIPNTRIFQFGYPSQWLGKEAIPQRLPLVADQLLHGLLGVRKVCGNRPIVLIGHCFGGLVIQKALIAAKLHREDFPGILQSTAGILFLGTPHRGSNSQTKASIVATVAASLGCGEDSQLIKAVEKDSKMLTDLLYDFSRAANIASIPLFCFFEQYKSDISRIVKPRNASWLPSYGEIVVDEQSGCIDGFPKLGLACDHFRMNKFSHPADTNFCLVRDEITKFVREAPNRVLLRWNPEQISRNTSLINDERDLASVRALFITDPFDDMEKIQSQKDKLQEDTGSWVISSSNFTEWLNDSSRRILWLHGAAGKGKTMLAISLVKELLDKINLDGSASKTALACFFCDNKDTRRRTAPVILRGLIYQLLCQRPDLCFILRDQYEKQREQLFASPNSLHSLWRIFQKITQHGSLQQVFIVVDALDECDDESIMEFLALLDPESDIDSEKPRQGNPKTEKVKWLLTSRDEPIISQILAETRDISLEANHLHVEDAVRKFIDTKLRQLQRRKKYDTKLSQYVQQTLCQKAEGTFLWVALACRELSKPLVLSVNTRNVLERLPAGIVPLYDRILEQVLGSEDQELADIAKTILRTMVTAFRPLTLHEMAIAGRFPEEHRQNLPALQEYVNQCGSLVIVRENTVYFVHQSAKAYLLASPGKVVTADPKTDHQFLALNCFAYVCTRFTRDHLIASQLPRPESTEAEPEYPIVYWTEHTRSSPKEITSEFDLSAEFFQIESSSREAWLNEYWLKKHAKWETQPSVFTVVHLCAYAGLHPLLDRIMNDNSDIDVDALDSLGNSPLIWAAKNGYESCVHLLLAAGVEASTKNHEGMTALQWAAANGHESIVRALFDKGASIAATDKNGWNPLHRAAYNGHTAVVRLLLDLDADIEAMDGSTWTALHRAASMGQTDVIQLLLQRKASIDALDREGMTPMLHAGWAGQHEAMMLLMGSGASIDAGDYSGCTALHNAAWNGQEAAVQFLLEHGASVDATQNTGSTPLHHAAWTGGANIARMLVQQGADVNAKDDEGETALQQAAWRGHVGVIEALLEAEVEIDMTNSVGHTALHQAASSGKQEVVRILLEAGADPIILDKHGQSARALAEVNEHDYTVGLLKEREREISYFSTGTVTPIDLPHVDPVVADKLSIPRASTVQPHQAEGFFKPEKITAIIGGHPKFFYMKSGSNPEMFESEYIALDLLHRACPTLAPRPLAWGKFSSSENYYLVTEWVDVDTRDGGSGPGTGLTLAQKVAKLHTTPAAIPEGRRRPAFGFPMTTYCGSTPQTNTWCDSWAKFFAENRIRSICRIIEENHGTDEELEKLVEQLTMKVIPKLLGNGHLGGKHGVQPVLIHGDLWEGNRSKGRIDGRDGIEPVTFDPASSYSHSEFELGLMRMFGGFSAGFFNEYHHLVPKTEPRSEYDDRMELYELYHWLNHYAIYSGGYRDDVIESMKRLCTKYIN